jgi:tetratricopeptide (TPR) repeat protein
MYAPISSRRRKKARVNQVRLHDDALCCVFAFLDLKDLLLGACLVSQHWRNLILSGRISVLDSWKSKEPHPSYKKIRGLGRECFDKEEWQNAIKHFSRSLLMHPRDPLGYFWRAYAFAELGQYSEALKDFSASLEFDPKDSTTFSNRGATYRDVGQLERALRDLQKAIDLVRIPVSV